MIKLGIIGLGRMGQAIAYRLLQKNHLVVGFDPNEKARADLTAVGGTVVDSIELLPQQCTTIWLMVPAGKVVDDVIEQLTPYLQMQSIIIDGGNSHFPNTIRRAQTVAEQGHFYLDCGTSGGIRGREIGFSLMIGGDKTAYEKVEPTFQAIAASNVASPR